MATWNTLKTWAFEDAVLYTEINNYIGSGGNVDWLYNRPTVSAYSTTNQSITTNTWTSLNLSLEEWDTNTFHDTVTNTSRLTIPTGLGGKYLVTGSALFALSTGGDRRGLGVAINGTLRQLVLVSETQASSGNTLNCSIVLNLAAGDYIELQAFQDSGSGLNVNPAYFQATWQAP